MSRIGRLPVTAVLDDLDRSALIQILTKPKNAIVKQYQKLFEFENVRLKFTDEALEAIAQASFEAAQASIVRRQKVAGAANALDRLRGGCAFAKHAGVSLHFCAHYE